MSVKTYVLDRNENYGQWLTTVGVPAELAAKMCAAKPKLEITPTADGVTIKTFANDKVFSNTIIFGQDSSTDIAGVKYTLNVSKTDSGYEGVVTLADKKGTVSVEESDSGYCQTITVDGVTCKRFYNKV